MHTAFVIVFFFSTGIPSNELNIENTGGKVQLTASVTTAKTTLGHSATITARDKAYQVKMKPTLQQKI